MATGRKPLDGEYDAVVIIGVVDDGESFAPGWDYAYSRALDRDVAILKERGYRKVGVFREPRKGEVARLLAGRKGRTRAVVLIGHGEFQNGVYSFRLNRRENLAAGDLRKMALDDVVKPRLSAAARKRVAADGALESALEAVAAYNFDFVYAHTCESLRDPQLRRVLGGEFHGNPWVSFAAISPMMSHAQLSLPISAEAFTRDPVAAVQGALVRALERLDGAAVALTAPGYRTSLCQVLADVAAARRRGRNVQAKVLEALAGHFSVDLTAGDAHYEALTPEQVEALLRRDGRAAEEVVGECGAPTRSTEDHHGCHRMVRGAGLCWQHGGYLLPPERRPRE